MEPLSHDDDATPSTSTDAPAAVHDAEAARIDASDRSANNAFGDVRSIRESEQSPLDETHGVTHRVDAGPTAEPPTPTDAAPEPERPQRLRQLGRALAPALYALVVFALAYAFHVHATLRWPGDVDEGFYALAGELTARGRMVYRDFFYPQAPLLPYVLGALVRVVGPSFTALRVALCVFPAGAAALVAHATRRETHSYGAGLVAAILLSTHDLAWQWLPSIRAYGLASFCATLAFVLLTPPKRPPSLLRCLIAGALAAVAPLSRLLLLPTIAGVIASSALAEERFVRLRTVLLTLVLVAFGWHERPVEGRAVLPYAFACALLLVPTRRPLAALGRALASTAGAALVVAAVVTPHALRAREGLLFGNLEYHLLRNPSGPYSRFLEAKYTLGTMVGGGALSPRAAAGSQFAILIALNLAALLLPAARLRVGPFITVVAIAMLNLRPNPIFEHYFSPLVPLMALGAGAALGHFAAAFGAPDPRTASPRGLSEPRALQRAEAPRVALFAGLVFAWLLAGASSYRRKVEDGFFEPWNMSAFRPQLLDEAGQLVRNAARAHPGPVLAPWEGSVLGIGDRVLEGFEDHFARDVAGRVDAARREPLRLRTHDDFVHAVQTRAPSVVVIDREADGAAAENLRALYRDHGYRPFGNRIDHTEVWVRDPNP